TRDEGRRDREGHQRDARGGRVRRFGVAVAVVSLVATACPDDGPNAGSGDTASAREGADLTVSAASSLTDAFTEIGRAFETANPGTAVTLNFGPSDGLAAQIDQGAPVDVFASASPTWMDSVQDDGPGGTDRAVFAQNRLAIIVPVDNPAGIENLDDLTEDHVQLVLAAEGVPAGDYAREMFREAGISEAALANVVSNEEDVRAVITKLIAGDADAGIGYVTDVTPAVSDRVTLIPIPDEVNVIATYPIAAVNGTQDVDLAKGFVDFVLGDGQRTLAEYGFLPPPEGAGPGGLRRPRGARRRARRAAVARPPTPHALVAGRRDPDERDGPHRAAALAGRRHDRRGDLVRPRAPARVGARARVVPREDVPSRVDRPSAGHAPGRRRCGPAGRVRSAERARRCVVVRVVRHPAHVHDRRGRARADVRLVPARRAGARGGPAWPRPAARGRCGDTRRVALVRPATGDAS